MQWKTMRPMRVRRVSQIVAERDAVNKVLKDVLERLGRLENE